MNEERSLNLGDFELLSLGGSGENGRNCFLLKTSRLNLLLDCGVKRELTSPDREVYPLLDEAAVQSLDAVFLSHAHEDHCGALPLLTRLGYRGPIYASEPTISGAVPMIRKWMRYVRDQQGQLPYDEADVEQLRFVDLPLGRTMFQSFEVLTGRSGHTLGSYWFAFRWGADPGWQVFYSGDLCISSALLAFDSPPPCRCAVLDSAYADEVLDIELQYARLMELAARTCGGGGRLLLPVPARGRGSDLLLFFAQNRLDASVWAEQAVYQHCLELLDCPLWLKESAPSKEALNTVQVIHNETHRQWAVSQPAGVYLVPDGMLTSKVGAFYVQRFARKASDAVLLTGHAAKGTLADKLLDSCFRVEQGFQLKVERLTVKVHPDQADVLLLCRILRTKQVLLFHAEARKCTKLIEKIKALSFD